MKKQLVADRVARQDRWRRLGQALAADGENQELPAATFSATSYFFMGALLSPLSSRAQPRDLLCAFPERNCLRESPNPPATLSSS
jgi:hypothetical protein